MAKNEIASWDEELAKYAQQSLQETEVDGIAGGQFISTQRGQLKWNGDPITGNHMAVIIVDSVHENLYYEGRYDPNVVSPPSCFAFGRTEDCMEPHEKVVENGTNQASACATCPMNEWGSSDVGKGKACKNMMRLGLISAGTLNDAGDEVELFDNDYFKTAEFAYLKIPPTSLKNYVNYVKQLAGTLRRPPFGVITRIKLVPDTKAPFKVVFDALDTVSNDLMGDIIKRHEEAKTLIEFPYSFEKPAEEEKSKKKNSKY